MSIIHVAIEDDLSPDDEPEGLFDCQRCGQPTWYTLCDECLRQPCGHSVDYCGPDGCEARGCVG